MAMTRENSREFAAIPVVVVLLGILFVVLLASEGGVWAWLVLGIAILVALVGIALWLAAKPRHPAPAATAAAPPSGAAVGAASTRRILLVADGACPPELLRTAIATDGDTEVYVVAPALGSRLSRLTGDEHAYGDANETLDATLRSLTGLGVTAHGRVGAHDPLQATDDGLREFAADEIVFAVHGDADANWLERGIVAEARERYAVPVREVTVGT